MAIEKYEPACAEWWSRVLLGVAGLCMITPFFASTLAGLAVAAATIAVNRGWLRSQPPREQSTE